MDQFMFLAGLVTLLLVIVFFVAILARQATKSNEMISFLAGQYKALSDTQNETHQRQVDSLISMNLSQADRHQKQIDSLLGLIDEMSSRQNPDKITARQYKEFEQYLIQQAK